MGDLQAMRATVKRAVELAGGPTATARALGIKRQTVHVWKGHGRVPPKYCAKLSRLTGGEISVTDLRPDIFPAWLFVLPAGRPC